MKSAFVSIIGRPSAGKSTLLNTMCGRKVAIASASPQTTRNKIRGIVSRDDGQLVFIDTPGYHSSNRKFNKHMSDLVVGSLDEVDLILYVVDVTRPPGEEEARLAALAARDPNPVVVALNKSDAGREYRTEHEHALRAELPDSPVLVVSALAGEGIRELVNALMEAAPEGELMYPTDFYTDQDPEFRASEIIREHAISQLRQELPHALYVTIADMERSEDEERLWIRAFVAVERESQKGIVVGKKGSMIKSIRLKAQRELNDIFPYEVDLDLRVKVQRDWRKRDAVLRRLIR